MKKLTQLVSPVLLGILCAGSAYAQSTPDEVFNRYVQQVNAGDMAAVRDLIADQVARSDFVGCTDDMNNKECLGFYIDTTVVSQHGRIHVLHSERHGDEVRATLELRTDGMRRAGVERVVGTDVVRVREGRIVSFHFVPAFGDDQTATFFAMLGIGPKASKD